MGRILSNLIWRFLERAGAQVVTFVVSVILARLLDPSTYGTVALVTVFTTFLQIFVDSGLGNALIQKKDADQKDFSTVFWFNIAMCTGLYILCFLTAPLIAAFYDNNQLTVYIRVISLVLIIAGVKNTQQAYVSRNLLFKKFFFSTLGGTILAAATGIYMAYKGYGVWALIAQMLVNSGVDTLILWITVKWRPDLTFSVSRLKGLLSYGWKLLASSLLNTGYRNIYQLVIGKMYSSSQLAFYNKGRQFPDLLVSNINTSIDSVLLPAMAKEQDNRERVKAMTRRAIKTSTFIIFPLMVGLGVCAEPVVKLLLTEKWLECVPFLRIFCFTFAFYPVHTANLNAIKAVGRSDMFLKLEIIKTVLEMAVLSVTMWFGVEVMAYSLLLTSVFNQLVNTRPNKTLLGYSYFEQMKDILPYIILSVVMGGIVLLIEPLGLIVQIIAGVVIYGILSLIFSKEEVRYVVSAVRSVLRKG